VAVFDQTGGRVFLGMPVQPIAEHAGIEFDLMIVATLDRSGQSVDELIKLGIPREQLYPLRRIPEPVPAPKRARSRNGKHS